MMEIKLNRVIKIDTQREFLRSPSFFPVIEINNYINIKELCNEFSFSQIMVNAFFLYKDKNIRNIVQSEGIKNFLDFHGIIMTDSGAYQALQGNLKIKNRKIVNFQKEIGSDIISPLDLITYPHDNKGAALRKTTKSIRYVEQVLPEMNQAILLGVQQGGRFSDIRMKAIDSLLNLGIKYVALGGLVPFFNKKHNIFFIGNLITQTRKKIPQNTFIHLYGAGDPVELPFYFAFGVDTVDSSSFVHYALNGWYMTPYGAVRKDTYSKLSKVEYVCNCPYCDGSIQVFDNIDFLIKHNLWTIFTVIEEFKDNATNSKTLLKYLNTIAEKHQMLFSDSELYESWIALIKGGV